jgi:uncharacterized membrane protein required for colicin V production
MLLDLGLLVVLLIAFVSGFRLGFVVQIVRLGVLVGSYVGARVVYIDVAPLFRPLVPGLAEPFRNLLAFAAVFLALYTVASLLVGLAVKRFHDTHPVAGGVDRLLGGFLGLVKSGGMLYLTLCFALALAPVLSLGDVEPQIRKSRVAGFVADHNLLHGEIDVYVHGLKALAAAAGDPEKLDRLLADDDVRAVLQADGAPLTDDPRLRKALEQGDWTTLLRDARVLKALQDPRLYGALERLEGPDPATPGDGKGASPPAE